MSGAPLALSIVALVVFGTIGFALLGVRRVKMDPQQFIVGGRSFGTIFLWVLLAGEIYTTFTFLGIAGLSYSQGAPAFYMLAYGTCGYIIGYFLTPAIWRVGKDHNLLTGPDFFETRYRSRALGVSIAVLQFLMIVPYVAIQLSGLQILLRIAGYGAYNATASVCVGFLVLALFVFTAGLRGTAWASIVKDLFVLGGVAFAGIAIPMHFFGSPRRDVRPRAAARIRKRSSLAPGSAFHGTAWFVSTVLLSSIGFFMGPQNYNAIYSARDAHDAAPQRDAPALLSDLSRADDLRRTLRRADRPRPQRNGGRSVVPLGDAALLSVVGAGPDRSARRARGAGSGLGAAARRRERHHQERRRRRLQPRDRRRGAHAPDARRWCSSSRCSRWASGWWRKRRSSRCCCSTTTASRSLRPASSRRSSGGAQRRGASPPASPPASPSRFRSPPLNITPLGPQRGLLRARGQRRGARAGFIIEAGRFHLNSSPVAR